MKGAGMGAGRRKTASRRTGLAVCVAFLSAQVAGCFSEHDGALAPPNGQNCDVPVSALGPRKAVVAIRGYLFFPDTLRVSAGTTVTWVNCDEVAGQDAHTSTSDNAVWSSPLFADGQTFARAFGSAGTFPYHCVPHTNMRAVIIVQ
ncbi:MAG: plastocyanin/azurin family copper-binding protein [Longimicrobiales bacterium]